MTIIETECRQVIWKAALHHPWPLSGATSYYEMLIAWYADPVNAGKAAKITTQYVAAMQRDTRLD